MKYNIYRFSMNNSPNDLLKNREIGTSLMEALVIYSSSKANNTETAGVKEYGVNIKKKNQE